ncbi:MAG: hypothetical protein PHG66_05430 [Candidatus Colwellbacteria bacterium]|nr:hypothetical protein [Candidatus Colwellbacteria bacterium]
MEERIKRFLKSCMDAILAYEAKTMSRRDAAITVVDAGMREGLWDDGTEDTVAIITMAMELTSPDDVYSGDPVADWARMKRRLQSLS